MTSGEQHEICRVVVHQARRLVAKGADGSWSNALVKLSCGKERFMTSVAEKSPSPQWNEDCEFLSDFSPNTEWPQYCRRLSNITKEDSSVELLVYHRGKLKDDFLGMVSVPLAELRGSHAPCTRWYKLQHRPSKMKKDGGKDRGEIEISIEMMDGSIDPLTLGDDCEGSEVKGQAGSSRVKRPSSLLTKAPGLKNKLKVLRPKSYIAVNKGDSTSPEFVGREKSDSNDSGRASDSFTSESPASIKRLSHNAQGSFGSVESLGSSQNSDSHAKEKKSGIRKKMKSAIGSLKRDKTHSKDPSHSQYSSTCSLPSPSPDTHQHTASDAHPSTVSPSSPSSNSPSQKSATLPANVPRNRTVSASDLYTLSPKAARPLSYPLRAISEEYIPLERLHLLKDLHLWINGGAERLRGEEKSLSDQKKTEELSSRDGRLRHSFRSGLPSLRNSNVSVTFDPARENGYGTVMEVESHGELPAQYVRMTKEELIRRLLLKERLLRERQQYIRQLEDYTDNLLLKVMLESPRLLDRDFHPRLSPTRLRNQMQDKLGLP